MPIQHFPNRFQIAVTYRVDQSLPDIVQRIDIRLRRAAELSERMVLRRFLASCFRCSRLARAGSLHAKREPSGVSFIEPSFLNRPLSAISGWKLGCAGTTCGWAVPFTRTDGPRQASSSIGNIRRQSKHEPIAARTDSCGFLHPAFCTPIPMHASTPLILCKRRMRRRARTDPSGWAQGWASLPQQLTAAIACVPRALPVCRRSGHNCSRRDLKPRAFCRYRLISRGNRRCNGSHHSNFQQSTAGFVDGACT
jgi:hypothetical protein